MSLPIELRYFAKLYSDEDRAAGMQPIQQRTGPHSIELYCPPALQYRVRTKTGWSEFLDVPYVKAQPDGEDQQPHTGAEEHAP